MHVFVRAYTIDNAPLAHFVLLDLRKSPHCFLLRIAAFSLSGIRCVIPTAQK